MAFYAAFYRGRGRLLDKIIKWWDGGPYSHCELVFTDGISATASPRDDMRVRGKYILFDHAYWDFIQLPDELEPAARVFFHQTDGMKYDLLGQVRFLIAPLKGNENKYWCSEWCAKALGLHEAWRYSPNLLMSALKLLEVK